jgi:signal transduction histidine kinase
MLKRNLCVAVLCGIAGDEVIRSVCRAIGLPRRKIPQALQNKQEPEKLSSALKARDDTLAAVSHDLRNLVNVISLASSNLAEKSSSSEKETRLIGIINRSTRQMDRMIQDLRAHASISAQSVSSCSHNADDPVFHDSALVTNAVAVPALHSEESDAVCTAAGTL